MLEKSSEPSIEVLARCAREKGLGPFGLTRNTKPNRVQKNKVQGVREHLFGGGLGIKGVQFGLGPEGSGFSPREISWQLGRVQNKVRGDPEESSLYFEWNKNVQDTKASGQAGQREDNNRSQGGRA